MEGLLETRIEEQDALGRIGAFEALDQPDEITMRGGHASGSESFRRDEMHEIRDGDVAKAVDLFQREPESKPVFEVGKSEEEGEGVKAKVAGKDVTVEDFRDVDP
jgi:hypothetical protein